MQSAGMHNGCHNRVPDRVVFVPRSGLSCEDCSSHRSVREVKITTPACRNSDFFLSGAQLRERSRFDSSQSAFLFILIVNQSVAITWRTNQKSKVKAKISCLVSLVIFGRFLSLKSKTPGG